MKTVTKSVKFSANMALVAAAASICGCGAGEPSLGSEAEPLRLDEVTADADAAALVAQLTPEEKELLSRGDINEAYRAAFFMHGIPRLGLPDLIMSDGSAGVRVTSSATPGTGPRSTQLPAPIALAATWDPKMAAQYGDVLGAETRQTGHNVILGPGVDVGRTPLWGRGFEAFGEDPHLSAATVVPQIRAIQAHPGMIANVKHYAVYTQETNRLTFINHELDEQTFREIYAIPFEAAVKDANVGSVMCSFPRVNGDLGCENSHLLNDVLKSDWGFRGWVMTDFNAAFDTVKAANAGLDQDQPGFSAFAPGRLLGAIRDGAVPASRLDDIAFRVVRTMFARGVVTNPVGYSPIPVETHGLTARNIARNAIVLLKNEQVGQREAGPIPRVAPAAALALPLNKAKLRSVAVIGPDTDALLQGGGASITRATYQVTPLAALRERLGSGVTIRTAEGTDPPTTTTMLTPIPPIPSSVLRPATGSGNGLTAQFWANTNFEGAPALVRTERFVSLSFANPFYRTVLSAETVPLLSDYIPSQPISARWTGSFIAPTTGAYRFTLTSNGSARVLFDGTTVIDALEPHDTRTDVTTTLNLTAGSSHALLVEHAMTYAPPSEGGLDNGDIQLGWEHPSGLLTPAMQKAVSAARLSDVAIVFARDYETEQRDKTTLTLPNEQDRLIQAVAAANPNTIVVVRSGGAVTMPWIDQVPGVVEAWYGGQEQGNAIYDVLFGVTNPSGKLPVTFPKRDADGPIQSPEQFPGVDLNTEFSERQQIGYRWFDANAVEPLFAFGHGLSYTTFGYEGLSVAPQSTIGSEPIEVSFTLTNTGSRAGSEVAQVYLGLPDHLEQPPKRLVGSAKVQLAAGASKVVTVTIDPNGSTHPLSYWNSDFQGWDTAPGLYTVYVGSSSRDLQLIDTLYVE